MSTDVPYFSVIVVGAGPVGLALGNLLGMYGLDALIIERNVALSDFPKAISLDDEGLRVCQAMGLAEIVRANLLYDLEARYTSGRRLLARVAPIKQRHGYPLISTFHQPTFESILCAGLKRFPSLSLQFGYTLESFIQNREGVRVSVYTSAGELRQFECAYLLACDGAKSTVRGELSISMRGTTYAQQWLVIDSSEDTDTSTAVRFFCNPARPAVTVPSPGARRRWEFMLLPGEQEAEVTRPENMRALIRQAGGPPLPHITRASVYTFHAAMARSFQQGRVFLLGDAAHLMPPFGGQGLNCGLRDAHNLAWKLWLALRGLAGPALLATYSQERQAHARQMINLSRFLGELIMPTARPLAGFRDAIFTLVNTLPALRNFLGEAGIKPAPRYRQGFFQTRNLTDRALPGLMLPQPGLVTPGGSHVLLDEMLGPGFALLGLNSSCLQSFAASVERLPWCKLEIRQLTVGREMHAYLPVREDLCLLVRPDRYIYGAFRASQAEIFARAFERHLADGSADVPFS